MTEVLGKDGRSEEAAVGSIGSLSWKERCFPGRTVTTGAIGEIMGAPYLKMKP